MTTGLVNMHIDRSIANLGIFWMLLGHVSFTVSHETIEQFTYAYKSLVQKRSFDKMTASSL